MSRSLVFVIRTSIIRGYRHGRSTPPLVPPVRHNPQYQAGGHTLDANTKCSYSSLNRDTINKTLECCFSKPSPRVTTPSISFLILFVIRYSGINLCLNPFPQKIVIQITLLFDCFSLEWSLNHLPTQHQGRNNLHYHNQTTETQECPNKDTTIIYSHGPPPIGMLQPIVMQSLCL